MTTRILMVAVAGQSDELRLELEHAGHEVETKPDGEGALERLAHDRFDLVVADVSMPGITGYDFCRRLRAETTLRDLPVILLTTLTDPTAVIHGLACGADGFVAKPLDPRHLADRVRAVLASERSPGAHGEPLFRGKKLAIDAEKDRILGFLVSAAEEASRLDRELHATRARAERDTRKLKVTAQISEVKYRSLVEKANDVIVVLDPQGRILDMNRRAEELFGRPRTERMGGHYLDFVPPEDRERSRELFASVNDQSGALAEGIRVVRADGSIAFIDFSAAAITTDDGPLLLAIGRDVTESKKMQAQLLAADRMASIGTLAAGVAHEINNPLASVMANLNLAIKEVQGGELKDELRDALEAAERIRLIVRGLRIFSRADEDDRGPVNVQRIMESSLRMAWTEIRHRARLIKDYGRTPPVAGSEARLGQVFLNLVVNAAQAIPEGNTEANEIRVVTSLDPSGRVVIQISDTGSGMPPEVLHRLFTPFFTTKPPGVGTGLGLSICHRIVTAMGGQIHVDSIVGKGTNFRVILPPAILQGEKEDEERETPRPAPRRGKILVVDDDPAVCVIVRRILGAEHDLVTAASAEEALSRLEAAEPFDVILCDLMMPQMTGMDLYAGILRREPAQAGRMIFMTAGAFTPRARAFLDEVPNHRVEKPFDPRGLRALINDQIR
ncbi:MAG: response regulator [Deltaproteobacteria bacterium]|nr:response regulator [Deltaproteobacteria bacterium]